MDRRHSVRVATLMVFGAALQKLDVFAAEGGMLTVKLDDWAVIKFTLGKKVIAVPVAEVFKALEEGL